jgi:hypothetical protein
MKDILQKANKIALEITEEYLNIKFKDMVIPVPYFINVAEQEYRRAMQHAGIEEEKMSDVIKIIKEGQTYLGAFGGKGSPQDIEQDLDRMSYKMAELGYDLETQSQIRGWMKKMHIGLDCSGYVYNVFKRIENALKVDFINQLDWPNLDLMIPSQAGTFIFDSKKLENVEDFSILPLDIILFKEHTHIGLFLEVGGELKLVDCSDSNDGITFYPLEKHEDRILIKGSEGWNLAINKNRVTVKRFRF